MMKDLIKSINQLVVKSEIKLPGYLQKKYFDDNDYEFD